MKELPQRKYPRLKEFDYSQPGYYYVTIHTADPSIRLSTVGWGQAPTEIQVRLTGTGRLAREQLLRLPERFASVRIDKYVIMPTHIHAIIVIEREAVGASPHPTLMDIVGAYKSLATRECNRVFETPGKKLFQRSFYETVLRNEKAYLECWRYIDENPRKWMLNPEDL